MRQNIIEAGRIGNWLLNLKQQQETDIAQLEAELQMAREAAARAREWEQLAVALQTQKHTAELRLISSLESFQREQVWSAALLRDAFSALLTCCCCSCCCCWGALLPCPPRRNGCKRKSSPEKIDTSLNSALRRLPPSWTTLTPRSSSQSRRWLPSAQRLVGCSANWTRCDGQPAWRPMTPRRVTGPLCAKSATQCAASCMS